MAKHKKNVSENDEKKKIYIKELLPIKMGKKQSPTIPIYSNGKKNQTGSRKNIS